MTHPSLIAEYSLFLNDLQIFRDSGKIDLSNVSFIYTTRLVLLGNLLVKNPSVSYIPPKDELVARYIYTTLSNPDTPDNRSYIPLVRLQPEPENRKEKLKRVYDIQNRKETVIGGNDAFTYVVGELVDNMYQHAKFKNGFINGQIYPIKEFVDICFLDDGITIQKNFVDSGESLEPYEAIVEAINGYSTVHEPKRGFGLSTSIRIFTEGLSGEVLVVSGAGAVHLAKDQVQLYALETTEVLEGTLISIRIPYPSPSINIYPYIE